MKQQVSPTVVIVAIIVVVVVIAAIAYFTVIKKGGGDAPTTDEAPINDMMQNSLNPGGPGTAPQPAPGG